MAESLYGANEESKSIWIYLEQEASALEGVSLELLARGREMATQMRWTLAGLVIGHKISDLSEEAFAHGADQVWVADHPLLDHFSIEAYARLAYQALLAGKPSIFLLGATPNGRDLAARLAVRLRTGLNADCTNLRIDSQAEVLVSEVSGFGGGVLALIEMRHHRPQMATVRPGVFSPGKPNYSRKGKLIQIPIDITDDLLRTHIIERVTGRGIDLTNAPVLVTGGRGIDGDFATIEELASLLDGEVGATRPPVDEGQIGRERQVGQTGSVCCPKLAICCGVSGAFQFVVGIEKAGTVIAINSDPEAPIFEYSDYCIVGDVHKLIPALITAMQTVQEVSIA
jgi:electron transfer flavoprotein alpha subunit